MRATEAAAVRTRRQQDAIKRLESDLAYVDQEMALASIAISMKRIADALEAGELARTIFKGVRGALLTAKMDER